jgi:hypothetical protein
VDTNHANAVKLILLIALISFAYQIILSSIHRSSVRNFLGGAEGQKLPFNTRARCNLKTQAMIQNRFVANVPARSRCRREGVPHRWGSADSVFPTTTCGQQLLPQQHGTYSSVLPAKASNKSCCSTHLICQALKTELGEFTNRQSKNNYSQCSKKREASKRRKPFQS